MRSPSESREIQFVKFGGSLITDKTRAYTARPRVIARLAGEVRAARDADPGLRLLLGHGSGSFGHWAAERHGTAEGVSTSAEWRGYAKVAAAAARLNRMVTDAFLEADVPVLSLQPSASVRCRDGEVTHLSVRPIRHALRNGLVPLVYGDVALDDVRGGTIASTEDLFVYLAGVLWPRRILLLGRVPGVLNTDGEVISRITPASYPSWREVLSSSAGVDVTGGMADKVARMVNLVRVRPETTVRILTGARQGLLTRVLVGEEEGAGTAIVADGVPGDRPRGQDGPSGG
jgi:isopentenyl phosphate kinase